MQTFRTTAAEPHALNPVHALPASLIRNKMRPSESSVALATHEGYPQLLPQRCSVAWLVWHKQEQAFTEPRPLNPVRALPASLLNLVLRPSEPSVALATHHGYPQPLPQRCSVAWLVWHKQEQAFTEPRPLNPVRALPASLLNLVLRPSEPSVALATHHGYPQPLPQRCSVAWLVWHKQEQAFTEPRPLNGA